MQATLGLRLRASDRFEQILRSLLGYQPSDLRNDDGVVGDSEPRPDRVRGLLEGGSAASRYAGDVDRVGEDRDPVRAGSVVQRMLARKRRR